MTRREPDFTLFIDGACSGNPGHAAVGVVIRDNRRDRAETISQYIGMATNNIAEYSALLIALRRVLELGGGSVLVNSDSELLVKQLRGEYQVKNGKLKDLNAEANRLLNQLSAADINHVRREFNADADRLARKAIKDFKRANRMVASPSGDEESPSSTGQRSG